MVKFRHSYVIPILVPSWFIITFVLTYIFAVVRKDVNPLFPYISDTGSWPPESCFFGIMINIGALLLAIFVYFRYGQVKQLFKDHNFKPFVNKYNNISVVLGLIASFGICVVANFQEIHLLSVHLIGAVLCFGIGVPYLYVQTKISIGMYPDVGSLSTNWIRGFCTVVCALSVCICGITGASSFLFYNGKDITKWYMEDGGFHLHITSVISEWILAGFTIIYIFTFYQDFRKLSIEEPEFIVL